MSYPLNQPAPARFDEAHQQQTMMRSRLITPNVGEVQVLGNKAATDTDAIYGLGGNDILSGHAGKNGYVPTIRLYGGTGNDIIYGEWFYTGEYYRVGPAAFQTQYADEVTLTGPGPSLYGESGNDTLLGSLMDDTLDGGTGRSRTQPELLRLVRRTPAAYCHPAGCYENENPLKEV